MTSTIETTTPGMDVSDLDCRETLLEAAAARRTADREEARLLALAIHQVHLYPVDADTPVACWRDPLLTVPDEDDPILDHLAGHGTPMVAERAVEELAAALDVSYGSACGLVAAALELRYRLPRLWSQVQAGQLQAWKARKIAQQTTHLGPEAVAFVDAQASIAGAKNRLVPNLSGLVHSALIRFEPENARRREEAAKNHRDVVFDYHDDDTLGSATLTATLDVVDAHDLDATVADIANQMGRLGDQASLGHRRAAALGLLAHPQRALDLFGQPDTDADDQGRLERKHLAITGSTLYVHVTGDDLRRTAENGDVTPADIETLGTATLDLLRTWLQRFSGITLKPVLDMAKSESDSPTDAVDQHDPPAWMRDLVILRDGHCVFPGCSIDARRCDLDHTVPYVPTDEGGPPGQTSPSNLACLCRRHHRLKTFTSWRYERAGPGTYAWTNPHGLTYTSRPTAKR